MGRSGFRLWGANLLECSSRFSTLSRKPSGELIADGAGRYDLVVVGSGVAGLYAALCAAGEGDVSSSRRGPYWPPRAGSRRAVSPPRLGETTRPSSTRTTRSTPGAASAGRAPCRVLTEEAPARLVDLADLGVGFDDELGLEGGHSRRRSCTPGGAQTGPRSPASSPAPCSPIPASTSARASACSGSVDGRSRCVGVVTPTARAIAARAVLLATGGYAALWGRTTNPPGSVGEGIALAYRAGATVADLEFVQFHPTVLAGRAAALGGAARRGRASCSTTTAGASSTSSHPRDVVARAIKARGTALLDLRPIDRARFPSLMERLAESRLRPGRHPVPVSPAAHYTMGGIVTDLDGATDVPGLYAAGECACTGVHGANRLASNSLLECLVFGRRAALAALARTDRPATGTLAPASTAVLRGARDHAELAKRCGRTPGSSATPRGSSGSLVAAPARAARRRERARPARRAAAGTSGPTSRPRTALDVRTPCSGRAHEPGWSGGR